MPDNFDRKNSNKGDASEQKPIKTQWRTSQEPDRNLKKVSEDVLFPSSGNGVCYLEEEHKGLVCNYSIKYDNEVSRSTTLTGNDVNLEHSNILGRGLINPIKAESISSEPQAQDSMISGPTDVNQTYYRRKKPYNHINYVSVFRDDFNQKVIGISQRKTH